MGAHVWRGNFGFDAGKKENFRTWRKEWKKESFGCRCSRSRGLRIIEEVVDVVIVVEVVDVEEVGVRLSM